MQIRLRYIGPIMIIMAIIVLVNSFSLNSLAQQNTDSVSRQRGISQPKDRGDKHKRPKCGDSFVRTIDGSSNNLKDTEMGAAFTELRRLVNPDYSDGVSTLAGENRPSARAVGNAVTSLTLLEEIQILEMKSKMMCFV